MRIDVHDLCTCEGRYRLPKELNGPQQLALAECLARKHGLHRAAEMIAKDHERRYPINGWEYGACIWCEVVDGKRRKATMPSDPGGGPPTCDKHADPDNFPDPPPMDWELGETQRAIADTYGFEALDAPTQLLASTPQQFLRPLPQDGGQE